MSNTSAPTSLAPTTPGVGLRTVAVLLGLATAGWLLVYGLALDAPGVIPTGVLALVPAAAMAAVLGSRTAPAARWSLALMPVAMGLVVLTLLVGTFALPGAVAWWVAGAVLAFVPFMLVRRT